MQHHYHKPHPSITSYIRTVLIVEGSAEPGTSRQPLFTNGMPALVCRTEKDQVGNEQVIQLTLFAKSTPPECWLVEENATVIAYFFKPFSMAAIFNMPVNKLMAAPPDLGLWNPHKTNALKMQLMYASSTAGKKEVLDNLLIYQLQMNKWECEIIRCATDEMMNNSGTEILSALIHKLNLNERSFQRLFKKYVGITPNQYRRICQFQLSFTQLRGNDFNKLTDVAYNNGFADQSHFIRSFREFTQTTPQEYLRSGLKKNDQ
ncbi:MAG TPA: AraC family transcriptional regulator [Parafilimonas sp.]|nr:AraC family transcriptional regulator [Parafilimonas sp.]